MEKKLLLTLVSIILLVSITSDSNVQADNHLPNIGIYNETNKEYTIIENNGNGDILAKIKLVDYSSECLTLSKCFLEIEVEVFKVTVDKFNDKTDFKNKHGLFKNISVNILIKEQINWTEKIPKYKEQCTGKTVVINGTEYPVCDNIPDGFDFVNYSQMVWNDYNGSVLSPSNYYFKFMGGGGKNPKVDIIPSFYGVEAKDWVWWDNDWKKKKRITITNNHPADVGDLTVNFTVHWNTNMNATFNDLRFLNSSESGEFVYWLNSTITENSTHVFVLVNETLPGNGTLNMYAYYNNSNNIVNESSKDGVFIVTDDFNDNSINASKWTNDASAGLTISETGNEIKISGTATGSVNGGPLDIATHSHGKLKSVNTVGQYAEVVGRIKHLTLNENKSFGGLGFRNVTADDIGGSGKRFALGPSNWTGPDIDAITTYSSDTTSVSGAFGPVTTNDNEYHNYRVVRNATHITGYTDNVLTSSIVWDSDQEPIEKHIEIIAWGRCATPLFACGGSAGPDTVDMRFDDVYARNYVQNEPTFSFSGEIDIVDYTTITKISPLNGQNISGASSVNTNFTCNGSVTSGTQNITSINFTFYKPDDTLDDEVEVIPSNNHSNVSISILHNVTIDGTWKWNCFGCITSSDGNTQCSAFSDNITGAESNFTFYVNDTPVNITINLPTENEILTSNENIELNWTANTFGNATNCVYNVRRLIGLEVENTTVDCEDNISYFNVTSEVEYTIHFYANRSINTTTEETRTFTYNPLGSGGGEGGGGGGGTPKTVCITNETAWKITTDTGGDQYLLLMGPGQKRSKTILISNQQSTGKLNLSISCQDINGTGCSNTEFAENELFIDPSLFAEKELLFTIELPDDFEEDVTLFNVVLTDQVLCENLLPVKLQKSVITGFISRLIQTIEFTFLKKISDGFPIIKLWVWTIILSISIPSGVIINIVLQKLKIYRMKTPPRVIGIVVGFIIATLLFIFL
ncbi:MAG: DUF2341 domain-containing protein [bacterium]|nr:DUF2341 domain-containing protein [bacterium]